MNKIEGDEDGGEGLSDGDEEEGNGAEDGGEL